MADASDTEGLSRGEAADISVRNVGGIEACDLRLDPGVSVLVGSNATNRTSLLSALRSALGGGPAALKGDADRGEIRLSVGGSEYVQEYVRRGNGVDRDGQAYAERADLVDLFVALLGDNAVRRAVERGDDLRPLLMAPVDTDAIEDRIASLEAELRSIEDEIDRVERRRARLPGLEEDRRSLRNEIDDLDEELEALRAKVAAFEADMETAEETQRLVDELEAARTAHAETEDDIEVVEAELAALEDDRAGIEDRLADLEDPREEELDALSRELSQLRRRREELQETITSLTTIVEFNKETLEGSEVPGIDADSESVTADLLPEADRQVRCWTCGSPTRRGEIEDRLEDLRAVIAEKRDTFKRVETEIEETVERRDALREAIEERDRLQRRRDELEERIADREAKLETLRAEKARRREEISTLESEVADREEIAESQLVEKYERISGVEYERGQRDQRLADIEAEIEEIEALPDPEELAEQRSELRAELETERGRIDAIETDVVETFNAHMDALLEELAFENVARVWLERKRGDAGDRGPGETSFELHVVRESREGAGYEDRLEHLSESERSVVGLVVALAGYLAHGAGESVPFVLLDSLEAIDAARIDTLVEYFADHAPYLVVALLPEDASAIADRHRRITAQELR